MRVIPTATTVAGLAMAAATLGACGSDDKPAASGGDYCQELKTDKVYFQSLNGSDPDMSKLDTVFEKMHSLAAAAPDDIAEDWKTLDTAVTTIENALAEAGLDAGDLATLQSGQVPDGVDLDKLAALGPKLKALSGSDVNDAADHIAENAKTACGVDLTNS
jgi:hypothetical protein